MSRLPAIILCLMLLSCGGGKSGSPTAPTPTPQPPPPPPTPVLTLEAEMPGQPVGNTIGVRNTTFRQTSDPGTIWVAVAVYGAGLYMVRGELRWDPAVLESDGWGKPEWWQQGGALCDWTHYTSTPGELSLFLDRPSGGDGVTGVGDVFYVRLKPKAGVTQGSSRLQWNEPKLYGAGYSSRPLSHAYGGTITIR